MALIFCDPFDQYGNATELFRNWTPSEAEHVQLSNIARTGANSIRLFSQVGSPNIQRAFPVAQNEVFWQNSHFSPKLPDNNDSIALNGVTSTFGWHLLQNNVPRISFTFDNLGRMEVWSPAYSVLLGRSNQVLFPNAWASFEFHVICDVAGTVEVRRNGQLVLLLSGVDTRGGGNGTYDTIRLGRFYLVDADEGPYYYDDFLCWNNTGAEPRNFLGGRRLRMIKPKSQANVAGWEAFNGGTLWSEIDNVPPSYDLNYISAAEVGATADFGFTEAPKNCSDVAGICAVIQGLSDGGATSVRVDFRLDGGQVNGQAVALQSAETNGISFAPNRPDGERWTINDLNRVIARLTRSV